MDFKITDKQKKILLKLARITIANKLDIDENYSTDDLELDDDFFSQKTGAFVTLHQYKNLRGCIGHIRGYMPLRDTIKEMALAAAFKDPRFVPLAKNEYFSTDIEISILSPIEIVNDFDDIMPGRDGLIISLDNYSGLLLPQVATEYGWSREEFISHTCMKAGLPGDIWKKEKIYAEKFSAIVFSEK